MDGSAIWLTSLVNMLTYDKRVDVTLLLKTPIKRRHVISNINDLKSVQIINPFEFFKEIQFESKNRLSVKEATEIIQMLDEKNHYDIIITRGKDLTEESLNMPFSSKQIPYITDFTHDEEKMKQDEIRFFVDAYKTFPNIFVQTEEMKEFLKNIINCNGKKFIILHPTVLNIDNEPNIGIKNYSIVYTGKFANEWKAKEMLGVFSKINEKHSYITLNIAGDKFQGELIDEKDEFLDRLKNTQGINWIGAVSREESLELIENSDIGFAYRSEEIDNDNSLELSTKFLEYGIKGKPVVTRRTKQYEKLLGKDYPLFADNEEQLYEKIMLAFKDEKVYHQAAVRCLNASKPYQIKNVSKSVLKELWKYNDQKQTILFAGHDFKFLNWYIEHCKNNPNLNVLIDKWEGHENHDLDNSEKLIQQADIIFCEWGLGNAVWYSRNKRRGQKLFIRLHRQEIDTKFLPLINYDNVDRVIVIVPHLFEEFNRLKKVPRGKMMIIENMIDYKRFNKPKYEDIQYNLGIVGILPKLKRLDRALDIFEKLWNENNNYRLYIKGKLPKELPWLMGRREEKQYFESVFKRIDNAEWKENVIFDPHGNDVDEWFRKIKFILSTSDIEGSHVSPMEGMASGSIPIVYHWPGAETAYPSEFIVESVDEAVELIKSYENKDISRELKEYPKRFSLDSRIKIFDNLLFQN